MKQTRTNSANKISSIKTNNEICFDTQLQKRNVLNVYDLQVFKKQWLSNVY